MDCAPGERCPPVVTERGASRSFLQSGLVLADERDAVEPVILELVHHGHEVLIEDILVASDEYPLFGGVSRANSRFEIITDRVQIGRVVTYEPPPILL